MITWAQESKNISQINQTLYIRSFSVWISFFSVDNKLWILFITRAGDHNAPVLLATTQSELNIINILFWSNKSHQQASRMPTWQQRATAAASLKSKQSIFPYCLNLYAQLTRMHAPTQAESEHPVSFTGQQCYQWRKSNTCCCLLQSTSTLPKLYFTITNRKTGAKSAAITLNTQKSLPVFEKKLLAGGVRYNKTVAQKG